MNMKVVLFGLLAVLALTGSQCINEGFQVAVNLPIKHTWNINGGDNTSFSGSTTAIRLAEQIDESYRDKVKSARYYDIRISVGGAYSGNVNGTASINGTPLLTFNGSWADFQTPQSLLGSSPHIKAQTTGIAVLVSSLNRFPANPGEQVTLSASGTLSQGPVPNGLTLTVEILAQVDAEVGSSDD